MVLEVDGLSLSETAFLSSSTRIWKKVSKTSTSKVELFATEEIESERTGRVLSSSCLRQVVYV